MLPELAAGTRGRFYVGTNGFVGLMPAGGGLVQWWFGVPWSPADPAPPSPSVWLQERFTHFAGPLPELLRAMSDAELGLYPHVRHRVPDQWGTGPTTLVGDAAHVFPPTQAQGANQTLEDAWLLTRALRLDGSSTEALRRYERRRTPRVGRVARMAASEVTYRPPSESAHLVAGLVPASVSGRLYLGLLRRWSSVLNHEQP